MHKKKIKHGGIQLPLQSNNLTCKTITLMATIRALLQIAILYPKDRSVPHSNHRQREKTTQNWFKLKFPAGRLMSTLTPGVPELKACACLTQAVGRLTCVGFWREMMAEVRRVWGDVGRWQTSIAQGVWAVGWWCADSGWHDAELFSSGLHLATSLALIGSWRVALGYQEMLQLV